MQNTSFHVYIYINQYTPTLNIYCIWHILLILKILLFYFNFKQKNATSILLLVNRLNTIAVLKNFFELYYICWYYNIYEFYTMTTSNGKCQLLKKVKFCEYNKS